MGSTNETIPQPGIRQKIWKEIGEQLTITGRSDIEYLPMNKIKLAFYIYLLLLPRIFVVITGCIE